jgi:NADH dehydrogenase (ubiquinone) Fe-S protein 4
VSAQGRALVVVILAIGLDAQSAGRANGNVLKGQRSIHTDSYAFSSSPAAALHHRTVRIFSPTKSTMQSGKQGNGHWRIDFDVLEGAGRWENPLMGWGST